MDTPATWTPAWSYFDFPGCAEAFCRGQVDARPWEGASGLYRLRGREKLRYTLVRPHVISSPEVALQELSSLKRSGAKVGAVNFLGEAPAGVPARRGPTEWTSYNYDFSFAALRARQRWALRRELRSVHEVKEAGPFCPNCADDVWSVWDRWVRWAKERHFMVFRGHYHRWIEMSLAGDRRLVLLVMRSEDGQPVALFGFEVCGGVGQVTICKHIPEVNGKAVWLNGLWAMQSRGINRVFCGSTADKLKRDLRLTPHPSWTFDVGKL